MKNPRYKIEDLGFEKVETTQTYKKVWQDYVEVVEIKDDCYKHYRTRSFGIEEPMFTKLALLEAVLKIMKGNPQGE